jgi:uncharacterized membrane protein YqjE
METNRISTATAESDMSELLKGALQDMETLAKQHIDLFKTELKHDLARAKEGLMFVMVAVGFLLPAGVLLGFTLAHLLTTIAPDLPLWCAYGIVFVVLAAGGGVVLYLGWQKFREATPPVEKTLEEIKEDAKWLSKQS